MSDGPIAGRVRMMLARGVIAAVDDDTSAQSLQVELLADEVHDGVERMGGYGFTAHPHPGAEVMAMFPGGTRSHGIVVAVEDRRYRLKSLKPGEVALYDDIGQVVHLTRDGIRIASDKDVTIEAKKLTIEAETIVAEADSVKITADRVDLAGTGGKAVARIGDAVANGVITGGSSKVFAA